MASPIGELLREWRGIQGMSQLDLALAAGVSSRHISFLETGRSRPSRGMVLRLAGTLTVPLRERNALLVAAGFAPVFPERSLSDEGLSQVRRALELVLRSHEPFPAFVLDRDWNVRLGNRPHHMLLARLLPDVASSGEPVNVMRLVLQPEQLRPLIGNWEPVAHVLGHRIRRRLREPNLSDSSRGLIEELLDQPGVAEAMRTGEPSPESSVVIPLELELDGRRLSWFSTIAVIGTPQDVTLDELQIESLFPADEETERIARELQRAGPSDSSTRCSRYGKNGL